MSEAIELLNNLSEDEATTYTADPTTEAHIVVDSERYVTVPSELRRIAVQFDHDIETVTFDCPRYWDDHDMSTMQVYINYLLPDGSDGCYIAKNVAADGELMHFEWTISRDVTLHKGNISFLVCVKKTDANGNEERHWNSELCRDLYVSEGLECDETVLSEHPDIITDLLTRMDTVEKIENGGSGLTEEQAAALEANTAARHEHENKDVLDTLTSEVMSQFDETVAKSHEHENKEVLSKLSEDESGTLLFDGKEIVSGEDSSDSGIYIGSGDMPEDCNVQIDTSGGVDEVLYTTGWTPNVYLGTDKNGTVIEVDKQIIVDEVIAAIPTAEGVGF